MTQTSLVGPLVTGGPRSVWAGSQSIYGSGIQILMRCLGNGPGTRLATTVGRDGLSDHGEMLPESSIDRDPGARGTGLACPRHRGGGRLSGDRPPERRGEDHHEG